MRHSAAIIPERKSDEKAVKSLNDEQMSKTGVENRRRARKTGGKRQARATHMADITVVYWRDIPAQVIVGKGRRGTKLPLTERFEQAIDRAAMKSGAAGTDDYLAEWRKVVVGSAEGAPQAAADAKAAELEATYDKERLMALIANDGRA